MSISARLGFLAATVIFATGPVLAAPEAAVAPPAVNPAEAAPACAPGISHVAFGSGPHLCPQPLAMTLIERKATRRFHT